MRNPFKRRTADPDGSRVLIVNGDDPAGQRLVEKMCQNNKANVTESNVDPDCDVDEEPSWALRIVVAIALTVCVVWLFSCLHPFVKLILETDGWSRVMAWVMFAVPATLMLACLAYVVWGYLHLPKIVKYSLKKYGGRETKLASMLSRRYLARISEGKEDAYESLVGEDAARELRMLRGMSAEEDSIAWLEQFKKYQSALDKKADREISKFSTRIGATTAISQTRATDMIAVIALSAIMLLKLARIYNQRMSTLSALRLALRWVANVYVAGEAQSVTRKIAKQVIGGLGKLAAPLGTAFGHPIEGAAAAKGLDMAAGAVGIAAEFAVNKFLARKLGVVAHKQLHALID